MNSSNINIENIVISVDGNVIGKINEVTATARLSEIEDSNIELSSAFTSKSFSGTFDIEYIDDEFLKWIEDQKDKQRKKKKQLQQVKNKKVNMREDLNNHFKKGKRW